MNLNRNQLLLFIRLSRPLLLLGGILLYGLGGAIAHYIGRPIQLSSYLLGQIIVLLIQLMGQYLNEYSRSSQALDHSHRTPLDVSANSLGLQGLPRKVALYAAAFCLALIASIILILLTSTQVPLITWLILIIGFLVIFFYNLMPIPLATSGYGEVALSFAVAGLIPAFAYTLQTGAIHRFLIMSATPLIALHFAMLIAFQLPYYASDMKCSHRNLLVRLGWPMAMRLHDLAILFAAISVIAAFFLGLPARAALNTLIALPLALAQIWQMERIRQGYPSRWRILAYSALALFALTAYLIILGFLVI